MKQKQQEKKMSIKKTRKEKGISQYDLAYLAGISRFRLFQAEKGHLKLSKNELGQVQNALNFYPSKFKCLKRPL